MTNDHVLLRNRLINIGAEAINEISMIEPTGLGHVGRALQLHACILRKPLDGWFQRVHVGILKYVDHEDALIKAYERG